MKGGLFVVGKRELEQEVGGGGMSQARPPLQLFQRNQWGEGEERGVHSTIRDVSFSYDVCIRR